MAVGARRRWHQFPHGLSDRLGRLHNGVFGNKTNPERPSSIPRFDAGHDLPIDGCLSRDGFGFLLRLLRSGADPTGAIDSWLGERRRARAGIEKISFVHAGGKYSDGHRSDRASDVPHQRCGKRTEPSIDDLGIKLAILPLHTWLPSTYVAAHPNTTALVASVVAKLGLYGIVRIVMPMVPWVLAEHLQLLFGALGAIAIVYGALCALAQTDMRSILAYSSLSHVGFITLGLMSMTAEGVGGATLQMFNHGIITASMFWILAMLEQRRGRIRLTAEERGLAAQYPKLAVLLVFFTLAGAGLPGLNGFVGEVLAMTGMMRVSGVLVAIAVLGTVLGAWYALRIVQRLLFGGESSSAAHHSSRHEDLAPIEWVPLTIVAALCLGIGVVPQKTMDLFQADTDRLARIVEPASKRIHNEIDTLGAVPLPTPSGFNVAAR
jgi:hypothetical protein